MVLVQLVPNLLSYYYCVTNFLPGPDPFSPSNLITVLCYIHWSMRHACLPVYCLCCQPCHQLKMIACCLLPCSKTWSILNQLLCRLTGRIHLFSHRVCEANDACSMETSWTQVKEQNCSCVWVAQYARCPMCSFVYTVHLKVLSMIKCFI